MVDLSFLPLKAIICSSVHVGRVGMVKCSSVTLADWIKLLRRGLPGPETTNKPPNPRVEFAGVWRLMEKEGMFELTELLKYRIKVRTLSPSRT